MPTVQPTDTPHETPSAKPSKQPTVKILLENQSYRRLFFLQHFLRQFLQINPNVIQQLSLLFNRFQNLAHNQLTNPRLYQPSNLLKHRPSALAYNQLFNHPCNQLRN